MYYHPAPTPAYAGGGGGGLELWWFKARVAARYHEAAAMAPGSGTDVSISALTYVDLPACIHKSSSP